MFSGDVGHETQLLPGQDGAGGIARVGDENGARALVDERLDAAALGVAVAVLRCGADGTDTSAGHADEGVVIRIEGLRHQHLAALVEDAEHGDQQSLAAAGGDENVVGGELRAQAGVIAPHRLEQSGDPG